MAVRRYLQYEYLQYELSYRNVEELLAEHDIGTDHVTIYRWVSAAVADVAQDDGRLPARANADLSGRARTPDRAPPPSARGLPSQVSGRLYLFPGPVPAATVRERRNQLCGPQPARELARSSDITEAEACG
jgi:hypothetical protein